MKKLSLYTRIENCPFIALFFVCLSVLFFTFIENIDSVGMRDPDDFMRLVRVELLYKTWDWYNTIIDRCNVPFGCSLHWTRLWDIFLIVGGKFFGLFTGSFYTGLKYFGCVSSSIIHFVSSIFFYKLCCVFFNDIKKNKSNKYYQYNENALLASILFICHPAIASKSRFGAVDHHILLLFCAVLCIYFVVKNEIYRSSRIKDGVISGFVTSIAMWASPESLCYILPIEVAIWYGWVIQRDVCNYVRFLQIKALITFVFNFVLICGIERQFGDFNVEYDRISVVHVILFLEIFIFWSVSRKFFENINLRISQKLFFTILFGGLLLGIFLYTFPDFIYGMQSDCRSDFMKRWLSGISEMQSPFFFDGECSFCYGIFLIFAICAIFVCVKNFIKNDLSSHLFSQKLCFYVMLLLSLLFLVLGSISIRMMYYGISFVSPFVVMFFNIICKDPYKWLKKIVCFSVYLSQFIITILAVSECKNICNKKNVSADIININRFLDFINHIADKPVVIFAHINYGAQILYLTKHSVVCAPYHRQQEGLYSYYEIYENKECNETRALEILKKHNSEYILVTKDSINGSFANNLWISNVSNKFKELKIPNQYVGDVKIFKICP